MAYDPNFLGVPLPNPVPGATAENVDLTAKRPSRDPDPDIDHALRDCEAAVARETGATKAILMYGVVPAARWLIIVTRTSGGPEAYGFRLPEQSGWRPRLVSIAEIAARLGSDVDLAALSAIDASSDESAARIRRALRNDKSLHVPEMCWHELEEREGLVLGGGLESTGNLEGLEAVQTTPEVTVPLLLELATSTWEAPAGVSISSRLDTIVSVQATAEGIRALQAMPDEVLRIESSRDAGVAECATSVPFVMGDAQRFPAWPGEDGARALVAIIDTGIDVLHRCFLDADGKSRIIGVWDQRDDTGPPPSADGFEPTYGTYYPEQVIAKLVTAQTVPERLGRDDGGHGTHVASIAAGRATTPDGFAGGMAPAAKIVVVIPKLFTDEGDARSIGYSSAHADALGFIKQLARQRKLPVVVNVSLGMNAGAHDGKTLLEVAFDRFTNGGRDPGCVVVKSAGNEFGHGGHASIVAFEGVQRIEWDAKRGQRKRDYFEAWFDSSLDLEFVLITPKGERSRPVNLETPRLDKATLGDNLCSLFLTPFHHDNGDTQLVIEIAPGAQQIQVGRWKLEIVGRNVAGNHTLHMWVERDDRRLVSFTDGAGAVNDLTLSIPGTARTVITVAAVLPALPLQRTETSSVGPTRDNRQKPDLCAPGNNIHAASGGTENDMIEMTGTSQAAPHVTGAIALLFSRQVALGIRLSNASQVQAAITRTTRKSPNQWHPGFGFGLLDTLAFIHALCAK